MFRDARWIRLEGVLGLAAVAACGAALIVPSAQAFGEVLLTRKAGGKLLGRSATESEFVHCSGARIRLEPGDVVSPTSIRCSTEPTVPRGFGGNVRTSDQPADESNAR